LFGSVHAQKLKKLSAEADLAQMEAKSMRAELLTRTELMRMMADVAQAMRQIVEHSSLSRDDKTDLFRQLSSIQVIFADVAEAHSRASGRRSTREGVNGAKSPQRKRVTKKPIKTG
jgi:hypothetical protein